MSLYKINLTELMEIYSFANTPNFIFNKFRTNSSVRALSNINSSETLLISFNEILNLQKFRLEDATLAYALLIALSLKKEWSSLKPVIIAQPINKLRWADYLVKLIDAKNVPTSSVSFQYIQRPTFNTGRVSATNQNTLLV